MLVSLYVLPAAAATPPTCAVCRFITGNEQAAPLWDKHGFSGIGIGIISRQHFVFLFNLDWVGICQITRDGSCVRADLALCATPPAPLTSSAKKATCVSKPLS